MNLSESKGVQSPREVLLVHQGLRQWHHARTGARGRGFICLVLSLIGGTPADQRQYTIPQSPSYQRQGIFLPASAVLAYTHSRV